MLVCPNPETLEALIDGSLQEDESGQPDDSKLLLGHIEQCEQCQQAIEAMLGQSEQSTLGVDLQSTPSLHWDDEQCQRIANHVRDAVDLDGTNDLTLPCQLGDYELLEKIGSGGMGLVYRARQSSLNRIVALKVIGRGRFAGSKLVDRFLHEAESAAMLDHPGIVPVHDVGEALGRVFYVMSYVSGETLFEAMADGPLKSKAAAECVRTIADAIKYAHGQGIIHRDLKPSNILLDEAGHPKVADFGLAKQIESEANLTVTGQVIGTPSYMPPEQARTDTAEITVQSDVYSLGAILFHLLTGRPPYVAVEPVHVLHQLLHDDPISPRQLNPTIPRDLETITLKCLAKQPNGRYASAADLGDELERYLQGRPILARPMGLTGRMWRWCRRNRMVAAMSAMLVLLMITSTIVSGYLGLLAKSRADDLVVSNEALTTAEASATKSAAEARQQADLATEQAGSALRLLESMLFDLQAPYKLDAAAQEERRSLLTSVLQELENLPSGRLNENRIMRCRAHALLGLADTTSQVGDENGVSAATVSGELYQQAIDLLDELWRREPDQPRHLAELGLAYVQCGITYADDHQWAAAKEMYFSALPLCQEAAERSAYDLESTLVLAKAETGCGEALDFTGDRQAGLAYHQKSHKRLFELAKKHPVHRGISDTRCWVCQNLTDSHVRMGNIDRAQLYSDEFIEVAADLARQYPFDYQAQMIHSTAYERAGDVSLHQGNKEESLKHHQEALRLCIDLGLAAPDNNAIQFDVSYSYEKLAGIHIQIGNWDEAIEAGTKCAEMRRKLVQSSPTVPFLRSKLNQALKATAKAYLRKGQFQLARECYQEAIQVCERHHEITGTKRFAKEIKALETTWSAMPLQPPRVDGN
ncbi:MAG: protein kinase [Rubripirellula sp.]